MQRQSILYHKASLTFGKNPDIQLHSGRSYTVPSFLPNRSHMRLCFLRAEIPSIAKISGLDFIRTGHASRPAEIKGVSDENQGELSDEDDELCPVDCVREFRTDEEFFRILEKAKETDSLVVVDFYRTACGSCKYIEQGFAKLCRGSGDQEAGVVFLKHNTVPLFHFYKGGVLLEAFPTRDKERIDAAILQYTCKSFQPTIMLIFNINFKTFGCFLRSHGKEVIQIQCLLYKFCQFLRK